MYNKQALMKIATSQLVNVFGRKYLQDNYSNMCKAYGMIDDQTFQLFVGIKDSKDLPDRKATEKGWVVFGKVLIDAITGETKNIEYALE